MNLKNHGPIFVPEADQKLIEETLSKAALMDLAWVYAKQIAGTDDRNTILSELLSRAHLIVDQRKHARSK
jgi:hypothetical protein